MNLKHPLRANVYMVLSTPLLMVVQDFLSQIAKQKSLCKFVEVIYIMGLFDILEKAYVKFEEYSPQIMDTLSNINDQIDKKQQRIDERFESIIETYNEYPLRALKNELSRLNDSNSPGDTIREKALNKIIKERNSKIENYVLNYSRLPSSTLREERVNVIHGRANYCNESYGCMKITKVEAELRIIAIDKLLSERNDY